MTAPALTVGRPHEGWLLRVDDLQGPEIAALLQEHLDDMHAESPPESVHALDLSRLRQPDITVWTLWRCTDDGTPREIAGSVALKEHAPDFAELKSMRAARHLRGLGVGKRLLAHALDQARARGYQRVSLETGTTPYFLAAQHLYAAAGFTECGPFADYRPDPHSLFMTLSLAD